MDELLQEVRQINSLLRLALSETIAAKVRDHLARESFRTVLTLLNEAEGEVSTATVQEQARVQGLARSTFFKVVDKLVDDGLVERPKRGSIALAEYAVRFVPVRRSDEAKLRPHKNATETPRGIEEATGIGEDRVGASDV